MNTLHVVILELPCSNAFREHDIQLLIGSAPRLWNSEVRPNQRDRGQATKEESDLASRICLILVDEIGNLNRHDYAERSLHCGCHGNSFAADFCSGNLAKDNEADWSDRKIVTEIPDEHQSTLSPADRWTVRVVRTAVQNRDNEEQ